MSLFFLCFRHLQKSPMPATRTYNPPPPKIPAGDVFCANPRVLRDPDPRPHTYGVRVCSCAAFATDPCRPTACTMPSPYPSTDHCSLLGYRYVSPNGDGFPLAYSVTHSHTDHSSLITAHSSYTFSAKERDVETGLSYFGSRYYSSDLSIWLSVDPMSDKYPSTSPYAYCRNNPIILYDPNGMFDDWVMNKNGHIYWDENAINQETTKQGETYLGKEGQHTIGTEVWNYHRDKTFDEQKPVIINNEPINIESNNLCQDSQQNSVIEKIDKYITIGEISMGLPSSAINETLKDEAKFITNTTSKIVIASKIASRANLLLNIASVVPAAIRVIDNPTPENSARFISSLIGASFNALPGGIVFSIMWNAIDAEGGFDKIYNKFK